ncbi:MAG: hydroxymethylbilane synthase [Methanobacteriota archaeon]
MRLRVGSRASALARRQAEIVSEALREAHSDVAIEAVQVKTSGDLYDKESLRSFGYGAFVKELDDQVLAGTIDLAVHSLKDLPTLLASELSIAAIPPREPPRDVLVADRPVAGLSVGTVVGTSSVRRRAFLLAMRPDLSVREIRGNLDTRVRKWRDGEYGALVLAEAGIRRLGLDLPLQPLDEARFPHAPGQGALAVTAREGSEAARLASAIDHAPTRAAAETERRVLAGIGGGCIAPIGVAATPAPGGLLTHAAIGAPDGSKVVRASATVPLDRPGPAERRLVERLRAEGGDELLRLARP